MAVSRLTQSESMIKTHAEMPQYSYKHPSQWKCTCCSCGALPRDVRLRKVWGPKGPNLGPKVTIIIKAWGGRVLFLGLGGGIQPSWLRQNWIPAGALYVRGCRLEYRPTIWMCCDDERLHYGGVQYASLKLNNAALLPFYVRHLLHKGQWVHPPIPPLLQCNCSVVAARALCQHRIVYLCILCGLECWPQTRLSHRVHFPTRDHLQENKCLVNLKAQVHIFLKTTLTRWYVHGQCIARGKKLRPKRHFTEDIFLGEKLIL